MDSLQALRQRVNPDHTWPDISDKRAQGLLIDLTSKDFAALQLATLPRSNKAGEAVITLRIDVADGRVFLATTTLRTLKIVVIEFERRHGEVTTL